MSKVNARILNKVLTTDVDFTLPPNDDYERFEGWDETSLGVGEIGLNTHRGKAYANVGGVIITLNGDLTITLNSGAFLTISANTNIELVDQDGNPITPDSVVGAKITVDVSGTVQGLTLMKTGKTSSGFLYDDGAQEMGRLTDQVTLNYNNPFGNTKRFTDKTDAGTFANSVAYDWSTWNESDGKVLAYYFGDTAFRNLSTQLSQHIASTIDGLANDWYLANITQYNNIFNWELSLGFMLNYAPFNLGGRYYWTGTPVSDGNGFSTDLAGYDVISGTNPANTNQGIWVRECTVVGTTIT